MSEKLQWHATTVCLQNVAVVIRGAPGVGKSSLAMHMIETRDAWLSHLDEETYGKNRVYLVSDDYTVLHRRGDSIIASAHPHFKGYMAVRGVGIVMDFPHKNDVPVGLIVDLRRHEVELNEMPSIQTEDVPGVPIRRSEFYYDDPFLSSRLRVAFKVATSRLSVLNVDEPVKQKEG